MSLTSANLPRRYKVASVVARGDGFIIMLDDKELLTPARVPLVLPTQSLADAVATEWNAQEKTIVPATMPHTQLAMTVLDRVAPQRDAVQAGLLGFLDTELICHAGEGDDLRAFQQQRWQAVRDWLQAKHNITLPITTGLSPVTFDKAWAQAALAALDIWRLTALQQAASLLGSLTIALALADGAVTVEGALDAAEAESDFQAGRWGLDAATKARRTELLQELRDVATFMDLLKA